MQQKQNKTIIFVRTILGDQMNLEVVLWDL